MAENSQQIVAANQGKLRQSIPIADITTDYKSWTSATIGGVDWTMSVERRTEVGDRLPDILSNLSVILHSDTVKKHADAEVRASFVVRMLGARSTARSEHHTFTADKARWDQLSRPYYVVIHPLLGFVVDGRLTIEIDVTVDDVSGVPPVVSSSMMKIVDLDDDQFADMIVRVKGEDWRGIRCHKAVVCHQSEAIRGAMGHSTKEAIEGIFAIGERVATEENVPLLVRLMYEDYKEDMMDKHVVELFILADFLLCPRVKQMTLVAIKRLLSVDIFWATLKAAVHIDHNGLISLCARFVGKSRATTLINREDGKETIEDKDGAAAFLVLMKEIDEMNNVTVDDVSGVPSVVAPSQMQLASLDDVRCADMTVRVKGEDWQGIRCHKNVVCRQSEAICGAMEHPTKEGIFEIGERVATEENVPLLVRLMYEDYKKDTMDKHVLDLYILADFLLCPRVKQMTLMAIKRLLAVDTFWATLKAAVRINDKHLLQLCARFAGESIGRLATLINSEDGKETIEDKDGAAAFLVIMKEIDE